MSVKAEPLAERAEALRGVEALAGDEAATSPAAPPRSEALGGHAAKGFAFVLAQSAFTRVFSFACQIILARLLLPDHFGLVSLADSVAVFANLLQLIGIKEILVARQKRFHLWAGAAFWITVVTGLTAGAIVAAAGPLAAAMFSEPDLPGLMLVLAISLPIWSVTLVPEARIQSQLRFRFIAALLAMQSTGLVGLTVVFAALGFGPYSFFLPRIVVGLVRMVVIFRRAGFVPPRRPRLRRWKYIISSSGVIFATSLLLLIVQVGERPIMGLFLGAREIGLYYFAFAVSLQTIMMISVNLEQILFATLARLRDEPERLLRGFLRASRVLATIVVPLCLIQSAVSDAAVRTVFGSKWLSAVPAMQILGVGMLFLGSYCPATAMLQAQQRFMTRLKLAALHSACHVAAVLAGLFIGRELAGNDHGAVVGVALAVTLTYALISPLWTFVTIRPIGGTLGQTFGIVARPLLASLLAVGLALTLGELAGRAAAPVAFRGCPVEHWVRLFVVGTVGVLAYAVLARRIMPEQYAELGSKFVAAVRRVSPRRASLAARLIGVP